jgi:hypothetical protein
MPALEDDADRQITEEDQGDRRGEHEVEDLEETVHEPGAQRFRSRPPGHFRKRRGGDGDAEEAQRQIRQALGVVQADDRPGGQEARENHVGKAGDLEDPLARGDRHHIAHDATNGLRTAIQQRTNASGESARSRYLHAQLE